MLDYKRYIREMPGQNRYDFTPLFANASMLRQATEDLAEPFQNGKVEKVAALDALGFVWGSGVALQLEIELALIRKAGKIPWKTVGTGLTDYSGKAKRLELANDAVQPLQRVLIVDDWSETGAQLKAAVRFVEKLRGQVVGIALVGCDEAVKEDAELARYPFHQLVDPS